MSRIYIEAYDAKGQQVLGNLDGQASLSGFKRYQQANAYKRVKVLPKEKLSLNGRVTLYKIVDDYGNELERITK